MLNRNLLRAAMCRAGLTQEKLADAINISANTFSSRMTGASSFNIDEIDSMCEILGITRNTEKADIFLCQNSQNWDRKKSGNKPTNPQ